MFTIAPPLAVRIISGIAAFEARNMVSTLTCITRRQVSAFSSTTLPRLPMPTLLTRKSSRPWRLTASRAIAAHWASSVTSTDIAEALPPSAVIISAVRLARPSSRSTTSTVVPLRPSRRQLARPLPMPSPAAPPPVTMATLPASPWSSSGRVAALMGEASRDVGNLDDGSGGVWRGSPLLGIVAVEDGRARLIAQPPQRGQRLAHGRPVPQDAREHVAVHVLPRV